MQLPQDASRMSIAYDYKVIILCMATNAMPAKVGASETLSFK